MDTGRHTRMTERRQLLFLQLMRYYNIIAVYHFPVLTICAHMCVTYIKLDRVLLQYIWTLTKYFLKKYSFFFFFRKYITHKYLVF